MNILDETLKKLKTLKMQKIPDVQDMASGLITLKQAEELLMELDTQWWTACQGEMTKLKSGLPVEEPFY